MHACAANPFPQPVEIHGAERAVAEAVARPAGLAPDHPSVIGAYRSAEPRLVKCSEHGTHVDVAMLRRVPGLAERAEARSLDVAAVGEVDAALRAESANDRRQIVLNVRGER